MKIYKIFAAIALAFGISIPLVGAEPVGTAFTYQGQLKQAGVPVNASCAMVITLWNDPVASLAANQVGPTITFDGSAGNEPKIAIIDGLFQVVLDFGANAFDADARWLQISVCCEPDDCTNPANFTTLSPRQELTPTPFSMATRGISVDAAGRVGIGSSTPIAKLHVSGTARVDGVLFSDGTLQITAAEEMPITWSGLGNTIHNVNNGNVGIGTTVPLETLHVLSGGDHAILGDNSNPMGTGVFGLHSAQTGPNPGVIGETRSTDDNSVGVSGLASAASGFNFGGGFTTLSPEGTGVLGLHFADTGTTPGVLGRTNSSEDQAVAVSGLASSAAGDTAGGHFESKSVSGTGVVGTAPFQGVVGVATAITGPIGLPPIAVTGRASSPEGVGVLGEATADVGQNIGVLGLTASPSGTGVLGESTDQTGAGNGVVGRTSAEGGNGVVGEASYSESIGNPAGVRGQSDAPRGYGVIGVNTSGSGGESIGVWGSTWNTGGIGVLGTVLEGSGGGAAVKGIYESANGWAGYFEGRGYFSDSIGIGTETPGEELDVRGSIRAATGLTDTTAAALVASNAGLDERAEMTTNSADAGLIRTRATNNNENVLLSSTPGNPFHGYVGVANFNGVERAELFVAGNGAGEISTLGFNGTSNVVIGSSGSLGNGPDQGRIEVADHEGNPVIEMAVLNDEGSIGVGDSGFANVIMESINSAGNLHALGPNGNTNVLITHNDVDFDHGRLYVADGDGQPRIQLLVDAAGDGLIVGDVITANVKNFRVPNPDKPGTEIWYASLEGPEAGAYFRGTATLVNGEVIITLPDHFKAVAVESGMTVQLTPLSADSLGLAVVQKSLEGISVKELHAGRGNYDFDYRVTTVRKGHEEYRIIRPSLAATIAAPKKTESRSANRRRIKATPGQSTLKNKRGSGQ